MEHSRRKVVFLMGAGHCGSTLVEMILDSHPDVMGLGELAKMKDVKFRSSKTHICKVCQGECRYWDQLAPRNELRKEFGFGGYYSLMTGWLGRSQPWIYTRLSDWFDKPILIDSSKNVRWIDAQLKKRRGSDDLEIYLIYVARDGRAVTNSLLRKYPDSDMATTAKGWVERVQRMEKYFADFADTKYLLRYEDLCVDPEAVVRSLCDLIQIDYRSTMLEYWNHEHHPVGGNAGTRALITSRKLYDRKGNEFYRELKANPAIKLDLRWQTELTSENIAVFEGIAGEVNRPYAFDN